MCGRLGIGLGAAVDFPPPQRLPLAIKVQYPPRPGRLDDYRGLSGMVSRAKGRTGFSLCKNELQRSFV